MSNKHIAVVGAGTAGLIFAHRMLRMGNRVTLFSDRSAQQWLHESPPTGSAFAYGISTDIELAAGLNDHIRPCRPGDGILFDCLIYHNSLLVWRLLKLWVGVEEFLQQAGHGRCVILPHLLNLAYLRLVLHGRTERPQLPRQFVCFPQVLF